MVSLARECFCTWATRDHESDTLSERDTVIGARRVTLRTLDGDGTHGLEGVSLEAPSGNGDLMYCAVLRVWSRRRDRWGAALSSTRRAPDTGHDRDRLPLLTAAGSRASLGLGQHAIVGL